MNSTKARRFLTAASVALFGFAATLLPGLGAAEGPHGGGGGGGHAGGGGAHFSGGHVGGGAHFGGGVSHFAGGARFGGGVTHFGGVRAVRPGFSAGYYHPGGTAFRGATAAGYRAGFARGSFAYRGGYHHPYWSGGYWRGVWWPRVYYGGAFAWFLPVLPLGCAVYWWGGLPYYYYNDVYYTYSSADSGYVVTDPPPVAGDDQGGSAAAPAAPVAGDARSAGDVYVYPRNGQTDAQTSTDKYECHKWAVGQTGFDPTVAGNRGNAADYRRALITCLDARGYSAN